MKFFKEQTMNQPPLGGCVLKQTACHGGFVAVVQPPLGGCVLKLLYRTS